jgi:hypothetical protein
MPIPTPVPSAATAQLVKRLAWRIVISALLRSGGEREISERIYRYRVKLLETRAHGAHMR